MTFATLATRPYEATLDCARGNSARTKSGSQPVRGPASEYREAADTFVGNSPALRWNLNQLEAQDAELVSSTRRLLAVYRKDLSYRGDQLALRLPNTRYFSVVMVGLHPARDAEFSNIV